MPGTKQLTNLNINVLKKAQYDEAVAEGVITDDDLSLITDLGVDGDFVPQYKTMPVASVDNADVVAQYIGATNASYTNGYFYKNVVTYSDPSASGSQTAGSGLSNITVDANTFASQLQDPSQDTSVAFTCTTAGGGETLTVISSGTYFTINTTTFLSALHSVPGYSKEDLEGSGATTVSVIYTPDFGGYAGYLINFNNPEEGMWDVLTPIQLDSSDFSTYGITLLVQPGDWQGEDMSYSAGALAVWSPSLENYGVTYSGDAQVDDEITVAYTAPAPSGYAWEQVNVQPGGGESVNWLIDYKRTGAQILQDRNSGVWAEGYNFIAEIPNAAAGHYEFYFQVAKAYEYNGVVKPGTQRFKVDFDYYPNQFLEFVRGHVAIVLDGNTTPVTDSSFYTGSEWGSLSFNLKKNGSTLYVYTSKDSANWGATILGQANDLYSDKTYDVVKVSEFKCGGEVVAGVTVTAGLLEAPQEGDWGGITQGGLFSLPTTYSQNISRDNIEFSGSETNPMLQVVPNWMSLDGLGGRCRVGIKNNADNNYIIFDIKQDRLYINGQNVAKNSVTVEEITDSSLVGMKVYLDGSWIKIPIDRTVFTGTISAWCVVDGGYDPKETVQFNAVDEAGPANQLVLCGEGDTHELRDIGIKNLGTICHYLGETDANYTKGYFYKADGTVVNVPSSETITDPNSTGVTVSDPNNFIAERMNANGLSDGTYILEIWDHGLDESQNPLIGISLFDQNDMWLMSIEPEQYPTMGGMTITGHSIGATERLQLVVTVGGPTLTSSQWTRVNVQPYEELLEAIYPVGSVYLGTQNTCPMATLLPNSTWTLVSSGKALWTGDGTNGNTTIAAALPNIKAVLTVQDGAGASKKWAPGCTVSGAFTKENIGRDAAVTGGATSYDNAFDLGINAHESNSIYDDNATTVQPPAYVVNVWRRTA